MTEVPYYRLVADEQFSWTVVFEPGDAEVSRQEMAEKFLEKRFTSVPAFDFRITRPDAIRAWRVNNSTAWVVDEAGHQVGERRIGVNGG